MNNDCRIFINKQMSIIYLVNYILPVNSIRCEVYVGEAFMKKWLVLPKTPYTKHWEEHNFSFFVLKKVVLESTGIFNSPPRISITWHTISSSFTKNVNFWNKCRITRWYVDIDTYFKQCIPSKCLSTFKPAKKYYEKDLS